MSDALKALAAQLREQGGLMAAAVEDPDPAAPAPHAAAVSTRGPDYEVLVEAIREGYLLHYGEPRIVRSADPDLALLAGDRLYALGLARLAERGDLHAVSILADVISRSAQAHAEGRPADAEAAWADGVAAVARQV